MRWRPLIPFFLLGTFVFLLAGECVAGIVLWPEWGFWTCFWAVPAFYGIVLITLGLAGWLLPDPEESKPLWLDELHQRSLH